MILKRKTGLEDVCVLYLRWRYELIKLIDYCINAANLSRRTDEMRAMGVEVSVELCFCIIHAGIETKTPPGLVELLLLCACFKETYLFPHFAWFSVLKLSRQ